MTEALFRDDAYLKAAQATVVGVADGAVALPPRTAWQRALAQDLGVDLGAWLGQGGGEVGQPPTDGLDVHGCEPTQESTKPGSVSTEPSSSGRAQARTRKPPGCRGSISRASDARASM